MKKYNSVLEAKEKCKSLTRTAACAALLLGACRTQYENCVKLLSDDQIDAGGVILSAAKADMSEYYFLDENEYYLEIYREDFIQLFEEKGSAVIMISFPDCPFCNRAVPVLQEAAAAYGEYILYLDIKSKEFQRKDPDEKEELEKRFFACLGDITTEVWSEDDQAYVPNFYAPLALAVREGEIIGSHTGINEGFKIDDKSKPLNDDQKKKLRSIYEKLIRSVLNNR